MARAAFSGRPEGRHNLVLNYLDDSAIDEASAAADEALSAIDEASAAADEASEDFGVDLQPTRAIANARTKAERVNIFFIGIPLFFFAERPFVQIFENHLQLHIVARDRFPVATAVC